MRKGMKRIGGGIVSVDGHQSWSNSQVILDRMIREREGEVEE